MYVRFPCQVFPISDCDVGVGVGRATGAASISWVPKYKLTGSQFRIMARRQCSWHSAWHALGAQ